METGCAAGKRVVIMPAPVPGEGKQVQPAGPKRLAGRDCGWSPWPGDFFVWSRFRQAVAVLGSKGARPETWPGMKITVPGRSAAW